MPISGALSAAGVVPPAPERAPARRAAGHATFRAEFAPTLRRIEQLQPALLLALPGPATGTARILAALAATCLAGSPAGPGPIPRQPTNPEPDLSAARHRPAPDPAPGRHPLRTVATHAALPDLFVATVA